MTSQFLERSDEQFVQSALFEEQRRATLAKLRQSRASSCYVVLFVLGCFVLTAVLDLLFHRSFAAQPVLLVIFLALMLSQHSLTTQIRLLEILQRGQFRPRDAATPTV